MERPFYERETAPMPEDTADEVLEEERALTAFLAADRPTRPIGPSEPPKQRTSLAELAAHILAFHQRANDVADDS